MKRQKLWGKMPKSSKDGENLEYHHSTTIILELERKLCSDVTVTSSVGSKSKVDPKIRHNT